ncbi:MAG: hypothetical protein WCN92_02955 [Eubacteriales bacterium]
MINKLIAIIVALTQVLTISSFSLSKNDTNSVDTVGTLNTKPLSAESMASVNSSVSEDVNGDFDKLLEILAIGETPTNEEWAITDSMVQNIISRNSKAAFSFQTALRVLLTAKEKRENNEVDAARWQVPSVYEAKIKEAFTGFRFFMTMAGNDDMVLWSENLQIQFASSEYFTAMIWPDAVFSGDKKSAAEHKAHAESRIKIWLEQRWLYGFSEWNSPTYYVEDISPLCLIIDFSDNEQLRTQAKIILDLMLYDMAVGQFDGVFSSTAGRCYENGRRLTLIDDYNGNDSLKIYNSVGNVINEMAGEDIYKGLTRSGDIKFKLGDGNNMLGNFVYRKPDGYNIPEVFNVIANDKSYSELKASYGLSLTELKDKGLIGQADNQIMMQWAMESFSNPETINNTLAYCRKYNLFNNENFKILWFFNATLLRRVGLLPAVSKSLNPYSNGTALQRANMYIYKTPYYLQATTQRYYPNTHGNQQHLWTVNFGEFAVFAANPSATYGEKNFWVSDGVIPTAAQDKDVTMSIYDTRINGLKIRKVYKYTHANFPVSFFDRVEEGKLTDGMIFGEKDGAYIALIAKNSIEFINADGLKDASFIRNNLVQEGEVTWWICETSDESKESFENFVARIASNKRSFNKSTLSYGSNGKSYSLVNKGDFSIDSEIMNLEYDRYESKYISAKRESGTMTFEFEGASLYLDFYNAVRKVESK